MSANSDHQLTQSPSPSCPRAEYLPWLGSGTLEEGQESRLREHSLECAECAHTLAAEERLSAFGLFRETTSFAAHVPAWDLAAYSLQGDLEEWSQDQIEDHLGWCTQCRAELALLTTSEDLASATELSGRHANVLRFPGARRGPMALAAAAGLLIAMAAGLSTLLDLGQQTPVPSTTEEPAAFALIHANGFEDFSPEVINGEPQQVPPTPSLLEDGFEGALKGGWRFNRAAGEPTS